MKDPISAFRRNMKGILFELQSCTILDEGRKIAENYVLTAILKSHSATRVYYLTKPK